MLAIVTGFAVCVASLCINKHPSSSNYSTSHLWRFGANSEKYSSSTSPIIMSDKLKVDHGHRKATITRLLGTVECLMAEDAAADVVAAKLKDVKAAFGDLEVAHDAYTDSFEAEADILENESWYNSAEQTYVSRVKSANDWIKSKRFNSDNANVSGASDSGTSTGGSTSKAGSDPVSQTDFMNMWLVP